MILEILLGISTINLFVSIWLHLRLFRLSVSDKQREVVNPENQMSQIENDLNSRLRTLQTAQFSPKMNRGNIRLVREKNGD